MCPAGRLSMKVRTHPAIGARAGEIPYGIYSRFAYTSSRESDASRRIIVSHKKAFLVQSPLCPGFHNDTIAHKSLLTPLTTVRLPRAQQPGHPDRSRRMCYTIDSLVNKGRCAGLPRNRCNSRALNRRRGSSMRVGMMHGSTDPGPPRRTARSINHVSIRCRQTRCTTRTRERAYAVSCLASASRWMPLCAGLIISHLPSKVTPSAILSFAVRMLP